MKPALCSALALGLPLVLATPALAWGPVGHEVIAAVAERNLSPPAKQQVTRLLGQGVTLADVANFADAYRDRCPNTREWHFVNIPRKASAFDAKRDCKNDACVLAALALETSILKDRKAPPADRELALRLIIHFVGDLHQPLHTAENNDDHGGTLVKVRWDGRPSNLHKVWDSSLMAATGRTQPQYVRFLQLSVSPAERDTIQKGTPLDWVTQAHRAADRFAYGKLPAQPAPNTTLDLDMDYADDVTGMMETQLVRAGLRLARLLDDVFATPGPKVSADELRRHRACDD
jgi:hypothetical protein